MTKRVPEYPINELFLNRWSPRALSPEAIPHEHLMTLFEAAKWAPSSFNNQPWRFVYANHNTPVFNQLLDTMVPINREWAQHASVLVLVLSHRFFETTGHHASSHAFDVGAACQNMALQASCTNLALHLIEGFNKEQARFNMNIPTEYAIEVLAAVGKPGDITMLPERLQHREKPSERKKLNEFVFKDKFEQKKHTPVNTITL